MKSNGKQTAVIVFFIYSMSIYVVNNTKRSTVTTYPFKHKRKNDVTGSVGSISNSQLESVKVDLKTVLSTHPLLFFMEV